MLTRFLAASAVTTLLSLPSTVAAQDCGPDNHIMKLETFGVVPDKMWFCPGQRVYIQNNLTNYAVITYKDAKGKEHTTNKIYPGNMLGPFTEEASITKLKVGYYNVNGFATAYIIEGTAPTGY